MIEFSDIIYGEIELPDWLEPFIKLPEFVRLRGVRLSNVDSYQFKDFSGPTRWEHGIAVSYLALRYAQTKGLDEKARIHLALGGLLHDVATPPFAHTAEYVLDSFDHELESRRLLCATPSNDFLPDIPIFSSQLPRFHKTCRALSSQLGTLIDPEKIAEMVIGEGEYGYLVRGTLDLDNADNVTRACVYLGLEVDHNVPLQITDWLATQNRMPTDLASIGAEYISKWLEYRRQLYSRFFNSTEDELGRQAFLQHIMRQAIKLGFPRRNLIWNTDNGFLNDLNRFLEERGDESCNRLRQIIQRYHLLEAPRRIAKVDIDGENDLRVLNYPQTVGWINRQLCSETLETFVMVSSRRHAGGDRRYSLFPPPAGSIFVFKLGHGLKREQLPDWLKKEIPGHVKGTKLNHYISATIDSRKDNWIKNRPWLRFTQTKERHILSNLEHIGDWGFRLSQNENMHAYPATFVYAIPASLIGALGLRGELILDPFGGTGQTAIEAIKYGGQAISADSNTIACMIAKTRLTFLSLSDRNELRCISKNGLMRYMPTKAPNLQNIEKWFHPETLDELCRIWKFIRNRRNHDVRKFLEVCFSAILTFCTARRGKEHGYFADNTPLAKGESRPPYQKAYDIFLGRIRQNLISLEQLYSFIERDGREPMDELRNARVIKVDVISAQPKDYGIEPNSVAGIITSPPYLCMADYTLGQRLSYAWLDRKAVESDFDRELGARRKRNKSEQALKEYLDGLEKFVQNAKTLLRKGGFLATVLGAPLAKAFAEKEILNTYDCFLKEEGFQLIWDRWRDIHWHRNHGYARLKTERVSVHVLR